MATIEGVGGVTDEDAMTEEARARGDGLVDPLARRALGDAGARWPRRRTAANSRAGVAGPRRLTGARAGGTRCAMSRQLHLLYLLIRDPIAESRDTGRGPWMRFLFIRDPHRDELTFPSTQLVLDDAFPGRSLDSVVDGLCRDLRLPEDAYAILSELRSRAFAAPGSPAAAQTHLHLYPVDLWVEPGRRALLANPSNPRLSILPGGTWLNIDEAECSSELSPAARQVLAMVRDEDGSIDQRRREALERKRRHDGPEDAERPLTELLRDPPEASMHALARKWAAKNAGAVRVLRRQELDRIFEGTERRAFQLRANDPFLRYQRQGQGFAWSFFSPADPQDRHVHSSPTVEIYGVLSGELEIWWKAYQDRGVAAWQHAILTDGDWLELGPLQCHIVHWNSKPEGIGVVFRAGPGHLVGIGNVGQAGKTRCADCHCMLPDRVTELTRAGVRDTP
jgi:hypothetical protein